MRYLTRFSWAEPATTTIEQSTIGSIALAAGATALGNTLNGISYKITDKRQEVARVMA